MNRTNLQQTNQNYNQFLKFADFHTQMENLKAKFGQGENDKIENSVGYKGNNTKNSEN